MKILPYSAARFSISGRDGSPIAPEGKVFYCNKEKNLKIIIEWGYSGFTTLTSMSASVVITRLWNQMPWSEVIVGKFDDRSNTFEIRETKKPIKPPVKPPVKPAMQGSSRVQNDGNQILQVINVILYFFCNSKEAETLFEQNLVPTKSEAFESHGL